MALIKNLTPHGVDLVMRGEAKEGVPPTASIPSGQTRELDVDIESPRIKGMVIGGAIEIVEPPQAPRAVVPAKPSQPKPHEGTKQ